MHLLQVKAALISQFNAKQDITFNLKQIHAIFAQLSVRVVTGTNNN